jgi:hypothetical protein
MQSVEREVLVAVPAAFPFRTPRYTGVFPAFLVGKECRAGAVRFLPTGTTTELLPRWFAARAKRNAAFCVVAHFELGGCI